LIVVSMFMFVMAGLASQSVFEDPSTIKIVKNPIVPTVSALMSFACFQKIFILCFSELARCTTSSVGVWEIHKNSIIVMSILATVSDGLLCVVVATGGTVVYSVIAQMSTIIIASFDHKRSLSVIMTVFIQTTMLVTFLILTADVHITPWTVGMAAFSVGCKTLQNTKVAEVLYHARISGSANTSFAIALLRAKAFVIAALTLLVASATILIMGQQPVVNTVCL